MTKPANPQQTGTFCWQEAKGLFAQENLTPGIPHPTRELIYLLKLAKQLCGSGKNIGGEAAGWAETTQHKKDEGSGQGDGWVCKHLPRIKHGSIFPLVFIYIQMYGYTTVVWPLICWRTLGISKCGVPGCNTTWNISSIYVHFSWVSTRNSTAGHLWTLFSFWHTFRLFSKVNALSQAPVTNVQEF